MKLRSYLWSTAATLITAAALTSAPAQAADIGACLITKTDTNPFSSR